MKPGQDMDIPSMDQLILAVAVVLNEDPLLPVLLQREARLLDSCLKCTDI